MILLPISNLYDSNSSAFASPIYYGSPFKIGKTRVAKLQESLSVRICKAESVKRG
jgi:hypothetical protein